MAPQQGPRPATHARRHDLAARLTDLAETQIAAAGLSELRARTLADSAKCSVGAIYGAVPDLDELVLLVNARTLDAIDGVLDAVPPADPVATLARLAAAYLDYAAAHRLRWAALFQHRMATRIVPDWYVARQRTAFTRIEAPVAQLCPALPHAEVRRLARSLFGAVHGMMVLGLDSLLEPTTTAELHQQVALMVQAIARGLQPASAAAAT
jgi:AcrR family transcriptional regulator